MAVVHIAGGKIEVNAQLLRVGHATEVIESFRVARGKVVATANLQPVSPFAVDLDDLDAVLTVFGEPLRVVRVGTAQWPRRVFVQVVPDFAGMIIADQMLAEPTA